MYGAPKPPTLNQKETVPQFLQLEKPYQINLSREVGESFLSKLASESTREYAWIFDEEREIWHYHPTEKHNLRVNVEDGRVQHELWLPGEYEIPFGSDCVDYHIHPTHGMHELLKHEGVDKDGWSKVIMTAGNQLPSGEDFKSCAIRFKKGFKESRVVTPEGVTTIHFYPQYAKGQVNLKVDIPRDLIIALFKETSGNMSYVLEQTIAEVNKQLPKCFSLSFSYSRSK